MAAPGKKNHTIVWLSHLLDNYTPQYGGGKGFLIIEDKAIAKGDSCNTSQLSFSNHIGSHVDAPSHFIEGGPSIDSYTPEEWVFYRPVVMNAFADPCQMIEFKDLVPPEKNFDTKLVDVIMLKTGFEKYRAEKKYWSDGPGLSPKMAEEIKDAFPSIKALGMDMISISSLHHRDIGRKAHRAFLSANIRLFEDLTFANIKNPERLVQIVALPLRVAGINGAPCTVIGWENSG